jgi:hypothetical protein
MLASSEMFYWLLYNKELKFYSTKAYKNHKPMKIITLRNTLNPFKINDQPPSQLILNKNGRNILIA